MSKPKEILELEKKLGIKMAKERYEYQGEVLTTLYLSFTQITDISALSALSGITTLDLSATQITDLSALSGLSGLTSLYLRGTQITDISALSALSGLTSLDLSDTKITDISALSGLSGLTTLYLSSTQITDISPLSALSGITTLYLSFTQITDISALSALSGITTLDLSATQITDISALSALSDLISLYLNYTQITDISALSALSGLTSLDLRETKITDISALSGLIGLTSLDLSDTKITDISALSGLSGLTSLYLRYTQITDISALSTLSGLTSLYLSDTQITDISALSGLSGLTSLYLRYTQITDVSALSTLSGLTSLYLSDTQITDISALSGLSGLTSLDLSSTQITDISALKNVLISGKLKNLDFPGSPIVVPPQEVLSQGMEAIAAYFEDVEKHGSFKLYEAKLLIVGEPGAGKTSLRKKLIDEKFEIGKQTENETIGVHIHNGWNFDIHDVTFTANIWDFGGQERQYPLHQYFLDDKSVYVLLSDDRADNYHLDKWFMMIRLIGGDKAKIILILNQKEKTSRSINFSSKKYTDKGFDFTLYDLDLSKDQDKFLAIRSHIQETLYNLDHVGQSLPKNICEPVREAFNLLKQTDDYIPYELFEKICIEKNIVDPKDQAKALDYLSTVGDVVHYKNDPTLKNLIILNPLWLLDAIYAVITCDEIDEHHTQGKFDFNWLATFLAQSTETRTKVYKESESTHILNLMLKNNLDICYKYNDTDTDYLIPLCMPENILEEPVFTDQYNLTWLFKYEIMPSGIVAKAIVRLSDYILDNKVSKNAVLLKKDNTTALLQEYHVDGDANKYIRIFVSGTKYECLEFLNEIKGVLKSIHKAWYKFIAYEEYIPCICSMCNNKKEAELHSIDEISKRINNNKKDINCKKLGDDVALADLIGHVSSKKTEKIRELTILLEDIQRHAHLNGEFNMLIGEALIEIQGNIFDVEDKVTKKPNSKLQALFEKGKNFKDWVAILGIPADVATKGEKMYQMLDDFLKNG